MIIEETMNSAKYHRILLAKLISLLTLRVARFLFSVMEHLSIYFDQRMDWKLDLVEKISQWMTWSWGDIFKDIYLVTTKTSRDLDNFLDWYDLVHFESFL